MTTTAFSTRSCGRNNAFRLRPHAGWARLLVTAWLVLLASLVAPGPARAQTSAEIVQLSAHRAADGVLLSAQLRLNLPQAMDEALLKGIPLSFVIEANLLRDRWYWYDKEVASATRYLRVAYQPLTRRWRVTTSSAPIGQTGLALGQSYDTLEEALGAIQRISGWKIADSALVEDGLRHYVNLRFRLDPSQLPRTLQIGVAGHSDWSVDVSRSVRIGAAPEPESR